MVLPAQTWHLGNGGGSLEEMREPRGEGMGLGPVIGYRWEHPGMTSEGVGPCVGLVVLASAGGVHHLVPLLGADPAGPTIEPSLVCPNCHAHGYVTGGAWMPV